LAGCELDFMMRAAQGERPGLPPRRFDMVQLTGASPCLRVAFTQGREAEVTHNAKEFVVGIANPRPAIGPAAWLNLACAAPGGGALRIERRARDGRVAALVEAESSAGLASHLLLADAANGAWQDVAVFEGRVEAMEWQGADLMLAVAAGQAMRVFSVFPGMRLRDAAGPGGLRWLRISTRRARR